MTLVRGGPAGPNGVGGAYENGVESDRSALWAALGGLQGVLRGFTHTGVAGQMALSFAPGQALVDERDAAGNAGTTLRGYLVWSDVPVVVQFNPASAAARNDAVVAAFVDTEDGPVGTGGLEVGPHLVVVPGVSGTTTPRTDADINAYLGRGGWVRLMDVPIASTDTQINVANIAKSADGYLTRREITIIGSFARNAGSPLVVRKFGDLVVLQGVVQRVTNALNNDASAVQFGNLPAGWAPPTTFRVGAVTSQGTAMVQTVIQSDGQLLVRNVGSAALTPRDIEINAVWTRA